MNSNKMLNRFLISLGVFGCWMAMVYFISTKDSDTDTTTTPKDLPKEALASQELSAISQDSFPLIDEKYTRDTIRIFKNSTNISYGDSLVTDIYKHLSSRLNEQIKITGVFNVFEKDSMGKIRAENLKNEIVRAGIKDRQVKLSTLNLNFNYQKDVYLFGVLLNYEPVSSENAIPEMPVITSIEKKIIRTKFGNTDFDPQEIASYIDSLKHFLAANTGKVIHIQAFTDSIGEEETNKWISLKRAQSIKDVLVSKGIHPEQIRTHAMGESNPIGNNGTPQGRQKNRRVEISIN